MKSCNGTFLLRFSDSELGGITIAWAWCESSPIGSSGRSSTVGFASPFAGVSGALTISAGCGGFVGALPMKYARPATSAAKPANPAIRKTCDRLMGERGITAWQREDSPLPGASPLRWV